MQNIAFDTHTQLEHDEHAGDHDGRLAEQRQLERVSEPKQDAQDVGDEQRQAHERAKTGRIARSANHAILRYIGHNATEYYEATCNHGNDPI